MDWKTQKMSINKSIDLMQAQQDFFADRDQLILRFIWKGRETIIAKIILKKQEDVCYPSKECSTGKMTDADQENRTKSPEINAQIRPRNFWPRHKDSSGERIVF